MLPVDVYGKADCGALLASDVDVGECWGAGDVNASGNQESTCDGKGLDRLVDRAGSHALHVDGNAILDHASYSSGN